LKTALEKLRRQLEMDNIYLYRMQQNNSVYTVILYGVFTQRTDALNALNSLPEEIKTNQPYLRTLAGVKKDIELSQKIKPNP
jgi:septal ring-binding cell division protein DamX